MRGTPAGERTRRTVLCALLLAVMLALGYIEHLLPSVAVPGVKLGLSNSVLIFAVYMLSPATAYTLMAMKVLLSGLLFSGVQAMAYAFAGGLLSLTGMELLSRMKAAKPVAVSMAGGLLHNLGQAAMATLILHTAMPVYWLMLFGAGLVCGALTGVAAQKTMEHLKTAKLPLAPPEERKRSGLLSALIAVAFLAVAAALVWYILRGNQGMTLIQPEQPGPVQMLTMEDLALPHK